MVPGGMVKVYEEQRKVIKLKFDLTLSCSALRESEALERMAADLEEIVKAIRGCSAKAAEEPIEVKYKTNKSELRAQYLTEWKLRKAEQDKDKNDEGVPDYDSNPD